MSDDPLERKRVRISGGELSFIDYGEGPAVVLLHGFPTSSFLWVELVPLLAMSMRVIAPDLLGYGGSDAPADADVSLPAQTRYVRELLAAQGIGEFAVVGHDLGGGIAQILAVSGGVRTLVLIDSIAFGTRPWPLATTVDGWFDRALAHPDRQTEELRGALLAPFAGEGGRESLQRLSRARDGGALPGESELARIDVPTLLLWGEDDPFNPVALAERLNEAIVSSSLALLPGCSHLLTHDAPEAVTQLLFQFLRFRYLGAGHDHAEPGGPVPIALTHRPDPM